MSKKTKYGHLSREQLEAKLEKLERERYGLVWEDKEEDVAKQCETELPVLKEDNSREIISNPTGVHNFIIEGDNFHSLYTLNFTHKKKIDVIYIDPPYNTGNKSWKFNNAYIDKEDRFKHSKWISFMNKRLRLSKQLLKKEGVIICAIDDYELADLKLLLDIIFGEQNRLGTCVVVHNPGGRQDEKFFPTSHEYMLVYAKDINYAKIGTLSVSKDKQLQYKLKDDLGNYKLRGFRRSGANSRKEDRPNLYYPIYFEEATKKLSTAPIPKAISLLPIDEKGIERCWRWNAETFEKKKNQYIESKKVKGQIQLYVKERESDNKGEKPKSIWNKPKYAAVGGTSILKNIFNTTDKIFDYPKSLSLLFDVLDITTNKNSIVLDFFAGSGTTGQAVLELNKDGGNRQFILCTNNENSICEEVTYPRIKKVIEGYADHKGIPANVKYYKQTFVPNVTSDKDKRELVSRSTELLCMAEDTFENVIKRSPKDEFAAFKNATKQTVIIYDEESIDKCVNKLNEIYLRLETVIYVFSYDHTYDTEDFKNLNIEFSVKPIPEAILNVYRKIAKIRKK